MTNKEKSIILKIKKIIFDTAGNTDFKFFLFGSRAEGTSKERSDYDIGVIGNKRLDSSIRIKIEEKFEDIPALIDFVDFFEVTENFKNIAQKNIFWLKR